MINKKINSTFSVLRKKNKSAFIAFLTSCDPNFSTSLKLLKALPKAGVDIIEIGMPFSDPMADGPVIQRSYLRALKSGCTLIKTLELVKKFRETNKQTPIVLMGYYNPVLQLGLKKFFKHAKESGVDGILIVDLPPEASEDLLIEASKSNIDLIRLATPTTNKLRIANIIKASSGFLYYVSITGITGSKINKLLDIKKSYMYLKKYINIPFVVGFGINSTKKASDISKYADGIVVGSDLIKEIEKGVKNNSNIFNNVIKLVKKYSKAINKKKI
ncbi:MAG: tryptophan synthase subunit alpha [Rickettsiales bacterium]|nr:tryptophan synthase subunit alpha [Rickettsiales bacterium]OUV80972.1 MAG: tryptophan synthase subunit alpha [Rickettsiales bacterium TMED131]|tara:strand:- start:723 stop:1541 length:819 start_codon:yes stop_codon:yes gene_type:complete